MVDAIALLMFSLTALIVFSCWGYWGYAGVATELRWCFELFGDSFFAALCSGLKRPEIIGSALVLSVNNFTIWLFKYCNQLDFLGEFCKIYETIQMLQKNCSKTYIETMKSHSLLISVFVSPWLDWANPLRLFTCVYWPLTPGSLFSMFSWKSLTNPGG